MRITPLHSWIGNKIGCRPQAFTRADLERWQLAMLRKTIRLVRDRSLFYRDLLVDYPPEPARLTDLSLYPFTTAQDLQAHPNRFLCVHPDEVNRIVTLPTSGTSGLAKRVFFTAADQELTIDFFQVGMSTLAKAGDRVLILLPGQRPGSVGDLLRIGLERLGCLPIPYGPLDDETAVLGLIHKMEVNVIVGAPVALHRLAAREHAHPALLKGRIRAVLSSTDILPGSIRKNLQAWWGCEVFDHYGMTETGLGGGVECEAHAGYHLREADLYYEVIDPLSGKVLPEGEEGEVVFTTLTREGMPFVRYRTGDISRILPGDCLCGSFIRRLEKIQRRQTSGVRIETEMIYPNDLDEVLFNQEGLLDFRAAVERGPSRSILRIEPRLAGEITVDGRKCLVNALRSIPAVERIYTAGQLEINITDVLPSSYSEATPFSKRTIQCIG